MHVKAFKYLISGSINTGSSLLIYWILLIYMPPWAAWTLSFIAGIFISFFLLKNFVFKSNGRRWAIIWLGFSYIVQFLIGLAILELAISYFKISKQIAPIFPVIILVPFMFIWQNWIFPNKLK